MQQKKIPTVRELIDSAADKYEDRTFLMFVQDGEVQERSFRQTQQDSLAVCRYLRCISEGQIHVAIMSKTSYDYITCLTGILMSGNVALPLSPDTSEAEAAMLLERADVELLFYGEEISEKAQSLCRHCISLKKAVGIGGPYFQKLYSDFGPSSAHVSLSDIEVDPEACAAMIYTSGTTGDRKAVMLSTKALVGNVLYHDYCKDIFTEDDVALSVLPMYHVYCFTGDYLKNLKDGMRVALNGEMHDLVRNLTIFQPKVMRVVPMIASTLLRRVKAICTRRPDVTPYDAARQVFGKNIRWLISGGAYLDPQLIAAYDELGIYLRQGYGMTEAGCRISVPDEDASFESVGRVIDICDARVYGGEIQVKSDTLMLGYYHMPQETAAMFTKDGWLRTGDIGYLTEDRQLFITGRVKNLIILSNGENVSPEAIEKKFSDRQLVQEVMVYAENDKIIAEILPNYVFAEENKIDDVYALLEDIVDTMNMTAKPSHVISRIKLRSTPFERTATGKLIRKKTNVL